MPTASKGTAAKRHPLANPTRNKATRDLIKKVKAIAQAPLSEEQRALEMPTELYQYPIEVQRSVVAVLVCCGTPLYVLGVFLHMSAGQVADIFADTISNANQIANSRIAGSLFNTALYEKDPRAKTTAAIFWLKARARWREDGSTPKDDNNETPNVIPLNALSDSQFNRIKRIVAEARPEDRKSANKLLDEDVIPPKRGGKNGKG